jgi:hypothetical protein
MGHNYCRGCGYNCGSPGSGTIRDPAAPWWKFWRRAECPSCGGDGYAKPPGWLDENEIRRLRPEPPPPSPPRHFTRVKIDAKKLEAKGVIPDELS